MKKYHKVKMLKTMSAYDDACGERKLCHYSEGEEHIISDSLLTDLINDGAVELVTESQPENLSENRETKVVVPDEPANKNKPSNKKKG